MITTVQKVDDEVFAAIQEEMRIRKTNQVVLVFPLGSQFDHLIMNMMAKRRVFCLPADPRSVSAKDVRRLKPAGIILTGGPANLSTDNVPFDRDILDLGIPTLGICLGLQLWAQHNGAKVAPAGVREFGTHSCTVRAADPLFNGIPSVMNVLQSHGDAVQEHSSIQTLASTDNCPVAAARHKHLWGVQFHPEVTETKSGEQIFENFCLICGITDRFPVEDVAARKISELATTLKDATPLLALSGGSDSSVVAYLVRRALEGTGQKLHALYIKGIDRPDDERYVRALFGSEDWVGLTVIDATEQFLAVLAGHTTMADKRRAMRVVYKEVIEQHARAIGATHILQGTLYTDVAESGGGLAGIAKAQIKLHHNTGLGFSLPEVTPLDDCVKDNARDIGRQIGVPDELLLRHPFPGPGLVVRIEGEITAEKLAMARRADDIYIEELRQADFYNEVWQAGAVITQSEHTFSKGDDRGSGAVVTLWAVWSVNGFTARAAQLSGEFLARVAQRITNEIREVGAVSYRISDKPPATIEWG